MMWMDTAKSKYVFQNTLLYSLDNDSDRVLARILCVLFAKVSITFLQISDDLVGVHGMLTLVDDTHRDIGAMVADTLEVGQQVTPYEARFHGTGAFLQSVDMIVTQAGLDVVNDLLQGLHVVSGGQVALHEGSLGQGQESSVARQRVFSSALAAGENSAPFSRSSSTDSSTLTS